MTLECQTINQTNDRSRWVIAIAEQNTESETSPHSFVRLHLRRILCLTRCATDAAVGTLSCLHRCDFYRRTNTVLRPKIWICDPYCKRHSFCVCICDVYCDGCGCWSLKLSAKRRLKTEDQIQICDPYYKPSSLRFLIHTCDCVCDVYCARRDVWRTRLSRTYLNCLHRGFLYCKFQSTIWCIWISLFIVHTICTRWKRFG